MKMILNNSTKSIDYFALVLCCLLAIGLSAFFLLVIKPLVFLPADLLMWEENDFVGNMIKFNIGAPLYTNPSDSNSMIYNSAAFLVTYAIAWVIGQTKSIAAFRLIQLGFVVCAAIIATICTKKLNRLAFPGQKTDYAKTWTVFTFFALFLAATAPDTNKFVYVLHVDALSLLVSVFSFWMMLRYAENENLKNLLLMAICPAIGFLTKQFLISWIGVMFIFLLIQHPKNFKRISIFLGLSGLIVALAYGMCYLIWGDNYIFWVFEVMGGTRKQIVFSPDGHSISLSRGVDHFLRIWLEIFVGVIGIWLLTRKGDIRRFGALAVAWFVLIGSEAFSSGAGWSVLYHFGPGVVIGGIFMFSALPKFWEAKLENDGYLIFKKYAHAFVMIAAVISIFTAWKVMPTGDKNEARYIRSIQLSPDVYRYIADIEKEFEGLPTEKVLLGVGSWIYLRDDVLQKDRAVSLADQPYSGNYKNFDVTVGRIRNKTYRKILVQDFDTPFFLYEWHDWAKPSGFKNALIENYIEVKRIEAPEGNPSPSLRILNSGPVSVFVPRN